MPTIQVDLPNIRATSRKVQPASQPELLLAALLYRKLKAAAKRNEFPTVGELSRDPEVAALVAQIEAERAAGEQARAA